MKNQQFPTDQFKNALLSSKNLKSNIQQILAQYQNNNMLWIYQSISILYQNLIQKQVHPQTKFNCLQVVQYIIQICSIVPIIFIQTYLFPQIKSGALCDLTLPSDQRGVHYFNYDKEKAEIVQNLGYNYVRLCTQIVGVLAIIKPYTLYFNEETKDPSTFTLTNDQIQRGLVNKTIGYNYFKQNPEILKKQYNNNLQQFHQNLSEKYEQFIQDKFKQQIKSGFLALDIRQLAKCNDCYSIDICLRASAGYLYQSSQCRKIGLALAYINSVVLSGNYLSALLMQEEHKKIKLLVKQVITIKSNSNSLDRGKLFCPDKSGSADQKKALYMEFLSYLELWANVFIKFSVVDSSKLSKVFKYYQLLKYQYKYEFPNNVYLALQIKQIQQNYKNNYYLNEIIKLQQEKRSNKQKGKNNQASSTDELEPRNFNNNINGKLNNNNYIKSNSKRQSQRQPQENYKNQQHQNKKKGLQESIRILTTNERNLPNNMKKYQQDYQDLKEYLEEYNVKHQHLTQIKQLRKFYNKIINNYSEYKTNRINYLQFCRRTYINPNSNSLIQSKNSINIDQTYKVQQSYQQNINRKFKKSQINHYYNNNNSSIQQQKQKSNKSSTPNKRAQQPQNNSKDSKEMDSPLNQYEKSSIQKSRLNHSHNSHQNFMEQKQKNPSFILQSQNNNKNIVYSGGQQQNNPAPFILSNKEEITSNQLQSQSRSYYSITIKKNEKILSNQLLESPIKNQQSKSRVQSFDTQNKLGLIDQFIQGPSLNPLNNSYHDYTERQQKQNFRNKSFKSIIHNDTMMIKTNKKQNLFWLETESKSLIRPITHSLRRSKTSSRINVQELFQQCNKKHQMEIKLLQHRKQAEIKKLETKVFEMQGQLKAKSNQLRSVKQSSQLDPYKQKRIDPYPIVNDQAFIYNKLNQQNRNKRKVIQNIKQFMLTKGQLINTKIYEKYFSKINDEKSKKIHLKNKQLVYKDAELEIGYMSQLNDNQYKIMCFVTPQKKFILDYINIEPFNNLKIQHNFNPGMQISAKKQEKISFSVDVLSVPYAIPQVSISYRLENVQRKAKFPLPCSFHKFITIYPEQQKKFTQQFSSKNIIRGEQIPYSRKILKKTNSIQDYLPHIEQLNQGNINQMGEECYGGNARYKQNNFYIKVCIKLNQFLYIQSIDCRNVELKKIIQFYIATLNHFFMKNIAWN